MGPVEHGPSAELLAVVHLEPRLAALKFVDSEELTPLFCESRSSAGV
jgi:hypothetical protein